MLDVLLERLDRGDGFVEGCPRLGEQVGLGAEVAGRGLDLVAQQTLGLVDLVAAGCDGLVAGVRLESDVAVDKLREVEDSAGSGIDDLSGRRIL